MATFFSRLFGGSKTLGAAWIGIDDLREQIGSGDPMVLIDVRQPEEYAAQPGHLPGAINLPLPDLPGRIAEIAAHKKPIVLVCKTDRRSARAAETLLAAGLTEIAILRGGTDGWHEQGLPLEL